jgi:hypothetical protein
MLKSTSSSCRTVSLSFSLYSFPSVLLLLLFPPPAVIFECEIHKPSVTIRPEARILFEILHYQRIKE